MLRAVGLTAMLALGACGNSPDRNCGPDLTTDPMNCGSCGYACPDGDVCVASVCQQCPPGATGECYDGVYGTENVGPCHGGMHTCGADGMWQACIGEVVPVRENCTDHIDNNCNGMVDEDVDQDGDGFTTCGGDCCDSTECPDPKEVNPDAFEIPGNGIDDDCDGTVDNAELLCDQGLASNSTDPLDFAKALDICKTTTLAETGWGVISADLELADGTGVPAAASHSIRPRFGNNVYPQGGVNLVVLSTGTAAAKNDTLPPAWLDFETSEGDGTESGFPPDFLAANGGMLPNAPGCAPPAGSHAEDPVMLKLTIRVPSNAHSFRLSSDFFSSEFPEYTCSPYNDFYVVLLDSTYTGEFANPADKNLAFYAPMNSTMKYPVGVNLATGSTGLFTQCVNGTTGCSGTMGTITTCHGIDQLVGTGFDTPTPEECDPTSLEGGATGWLNTSGNVVPGEIITLRIALWNTSDHALQSLAVVDAFEWSADTITPGTVIFRKVP